MAFRNKLPFFNLGDELANITGDVTFTNAGVSTVGSAVKGGYYTFAAGTATMTNGAATKDETVTGVANTDIIIAVATVLSGATPVTKVAYKSANTITITLSGNATTGDKVFYVVYRAIA